jgi:predicted DNA-binding protein with PD1-like motif
VTASGEAEVESKLLYDDGGQRTFAVILRTGDEAMSCLQDFAVNERISAAQLTAIGAFRKAQLAYFDWEQKKYSPIPVAEQVEVASLVGDSAVTDGKPSLHIHAVLGRRDGTALAGHLQEGHVRPTLEVIVTESPAHLRKITDQESGLALISPRS